MTEIYYQQWRQENAGNNYPFTDTSSLSNGDIQLATDVFLDAAIHPVGGQGRFYLSRVTISFDTVMLVIGDSLRTDVATAEYLSVNPPETLTLKDIYGRPAGLLVADSDSLKRLAQFRPGDHLFTVDDTEFVVDVCSPTPAAGVEGLLLSDGNYLSDEVQLVGGPGVWFETRSELTKAVSCLAAEIPQTVLKIHITAEPLLKQQLCEDENVAPVTYIREVTFMDAEQSFTCQPDQYGDIQILVNNSLAEDTVLRVQPGGESRLMFNAAGEII